MDWENLDIKDPSSKSSTFEISKPHEEEKEQLVEDDKEKIYRTHRKQKGFCLRSPPPSQHLKKILSNYPEGPQIFEEVIQNADDANATAVGILLDERDQALDETQVECPEVIKRFTGPSLVFYNNALFHEADWDSLQNMFESQKIQSPGKIGRFGMGSRSYFHLTDLVIILSGNRIAFLDPDWILTSEGGYTETLDILNASRKTNVKTGNMNDATELIYIDILLRCFHKMFGFEINETFYNGTLIRLPLRSKRWARCSTFAPYEYTVNKTRNLVEKFRDDAGQCLLFLQSLECLVAWRYCEGEEDAFPIYGTFLRSTLRYRSIEDSVNGRSCIQKYFINKKNQGIDLKTSLCQAETEHLPEIQDICQIDQVVYPGRNLETNVSYELIVTSQLWFIHIRLICSGELISLSHLTKCAPVVGIAAATSPPVMESLKKVVYTSRTVEEIFQPPFRRCYNAFDMALSCVKQVEYQRKTKRQSSGLAFSYLPLPDVETGLPVHLHGTFQLTTNRRSLWMALKDTEGLAQKWSRWNHLLISLAFPVVYSLLLTRFAKMTRTLLDQIEEERQKQSITNSLAESMCRNVMDYYYDVWPDIQKITPAFRSLLYQLKCYIKNAKLIIPEPQSLLKVSKRLAICCDLQKNESSPSREGSRHDKHKNLPRWKPTESLFLTLTSHESHVFAKHEASLYEAVGQCQLLGHPIVFVPKHVRQLLSHLEIGDEANDSSSTPCCLDLQDQKMGSHHGLLNMNSHDTIRKEHFPTYIHMFKTILLPHWSSLHPCELGFIPHFKTLMLCTCQILGGQPEKDILQFQTLCSRLRFVPVDIPGVCCDEDDDPCVLKTPTECFDPSLSHFTIACLAQPVKEFRTPNVLRVLRRWGLKRALRWDEMAQEVVARVCVIGGCRGNYNSQAARH